jgi:cullin 3
MFTDMRISAESANSFRNYLGRHGVSLIVEYISVSTNAQALPFELSANVLTASFWPTIIAAVSPCNFGPRLTEAIEVFEKYYDTRHSGRRLTWQGNQGTADIRVKFKARSHDLNVSTHALVVLLLFEDLESDQSLSYLVSIILSSRIPPVVRHR